MTHEFNQEGTILPTFNRATDHSTPFSDLRADPDTRLLRLWLNSEVHDDLWLPIDIARGGLSVVSRLEAAEHSDTRQNSELLRQVAVSAFTLYQHNKLTDHDGNLMAFVLPRNAFLQLGRMPQSHFDALRGDSLVANYAKLHVDDNDVLGIEANDLDNPPQVEVINADSETAVEIGTAMRNYLSPQDIGTGYVTRADWPTTLAPLSSRYAFIPSQTENSSDGARSHQTS